MNAHEVAHPFDDNKICYEQPEYDAFAKDEYGMQNTYSYESKYPYAVSEDLVSHVEPLDKNSILGTDCIPFNQF